MGGRDGMVDGEETEEEEEGADTRGWRPINTKVMEEETVNNNEGLFGLKTGGISPLQLIYYRIIYCQLSM